MVGRWGLLAGGGVAARGGVEVEEGLDEGGGGDSTRGDGGGRSGVSAAGGGGGGRGGVRGGGESRGRMFRASSVVAPVVSGRLWVRPGLLHCSVVDRVRAAAGWEVATSVIAGGSEVIPLDVSDEPPA